MRAAAIHLMDYIPEPIRDYLRRRTAELTGLALLAFVAASFAALITWSAQDPSLNHAVAGPTHNLLGRSGAFIADLMMQLFGVTSAVMLAPLSVWGWQLLTQRRLSRSRLRLMLWCVGAIAAAGVIAYFPVTDRWPLRTGLGGVLGDGVLRASSPRVFKSTPRLTSLSNSAVMRAGNQLKTSSARAAHLPAHSQCTP